MKVLWITNTDITTEPLVHSLDCYAEEFGLEISKRYYNCNCSYDDIDADLVIYMGAAELETTPPIGKLQAIREKSKLVMICCDTSCTGWAPHIATYHKNDCFDFIVNIDGNDHWEKVGKDYTTLAPIDQRYYKNHIPWDDRTTLLGFRGSANPARLALIRRVGPTLSFYPRGDIFGDYADYVSFMNNCKFVFCMNERNIVKARALEAAYAGACFIEQRCSQTDNTMNKWFKNDNFILYDKPEEVCDLVSNHLSKGKEMAESFSKEVKEKYNAKLFWQRILEW